MESDQIIATRARIIEAAKTLFVERGYHGTTMRQIAGAAGIALGGIYNHFATKEEIFEAVAVAYHPFALVLPGLAEVEGDSVEDILRRAAEGIVAVLDPQPQMMNLLFIELIELNGRHIQAIAGRVLPAALPLIARLQALHPPLRTRPPLLILRSFLGLIIAHLFTADLLRNVQVGEDELGSLDDFMDIYLFGLIGKG